MPCMLPSRALAEPFTHLGEGIASGSTRGPPVASFEVDRVKQALLCLLIEVFISSHFPTRKDIWAAKLILSQSIHYQLFPHPPMS